MHAKEILRTCKSTRVNNTAQSKWKSRHTEISYFFSLEIVCCVWRHPLSEKNCKIKYGPVKYLPLNFWMISMLSAFLNNKVEKCQTNTIFIYSTLRTSIFPVRNSGRKIKRHWDSLRMPIPLDVSPKRSDMAIFMMDIRKRVVRDMWSFRTKLQQTKIAATKI